MPYDDIKSLLKKRLTEKRCYHSLCVADAARHLAEKYGADADKMYLAGLLHDITVEIVRKVWYNSNRCRKSVASDMARDVGRSLCRT